MLLKAFGTFSYPLVRSNWIYSPETPDLVQNLRFLSRVTLNLTDNLEKQQGTSPKQHDVLCIISSP